MNILCKIFGHDRREVEIPTPVFIWKSILGDVVVTKRCVTVTQTICRRCDKPFVPDGYKLLASGALVRHPHISYAEGYKKLSDQIKARQ